MYTSINFETKKALKEAVTAGKRITYFQPGPFGGNEPQNGKIYCEGPHYPKPHKWYGCQKKNERRKRFKRRSDHLINVRFL